MKLTLNIRTLIAMAISLISVMVFVIPANAWPTEKYAANSALVQGKWAKVKVNEEGMQFVSNEQLREMGFSDPSKVNVYGFGGRLIDEYLHADHPDDLPLLPSVKTQKGLVFFGHNTVRWTPSYSSNLEYTHEINYFSNDSYYFLSDREISNSPLQGVDASAVESTPCASTFTQYLLHEVDLYHPGESGRIMLGEDFRSKTTQIFDFALPGHVEGTEVSVATQFAALSFSGNSNLMFKANGKQLPSASSDMIPLKRNPETCMALASTIKQISDLGTSLAFEIKFNAGPSISLARLDYIHVEYPRHISLSGTNDLYFSLDSHGMNISVSNAKATTKIWDVTDSESPVELSYALEGTTAKFRPIAQGFRRYVAFNPDAVNRKVEIAGTVANQDIHGMPTPDMVIITPAEFLTEANRLADLHRDVDNMVVHVLTPEAIYNEFSSGAQDVSAFRKCLKMWYDRSTEDRKLGYCILFGRPTYDPRMITEKVRSDGYPRLPIWQSTETAEMDYSYSTDSFVAMLSDNDYNRTMGNRSLNVNMGRIPVKNVQEASDAVDKIIRYVKNPVYGSWRNKVMIIADDQNNNQHIMQGETVYKTLRDSGNGDQFSYDRLYLDAYEWEASPSGYYYRIPHDKLQKAFIDGVLYMDYIGHAQKQSWGHEGLLPRADILAQQSERYPWIYAATCDFGYMDGDDISGAETMFLNPIGGAIGLYTTTRKVYISPNGLLNRAISQDLFVHDDGKGKTFGEIFTSGMNRMLGGDTNKLRYYLLGDPALRIANPVLNAELLSINGQSTLDPENLPEVGARGKALFKGRIAKPDGSTDTDFNGRLEVTLFDAERPIETHGHESLESSGEVYNYNDYVNMLYSGIASVKDGEWELSIVVPIEIDNNYSPALFNMYAWSEDGVEANGANNNFYIYGLSENPVDDTVGPEITNFFINNPALKDGDIVGSEITVYASLSDESGISTASSAIGHFIAISVDGRKTYDATTGFMATGPDSGDVTFTISDVEPGTHEITLIAWDNAGNSSAATRTVRVAAYSHPTIYDVTTSASPAKTDVTFFIDHDQASARTISRIDVYDLGGRKVWSSADFNGSAAQGAVAIPWKLTDAGGKRIPRGIYVYRATIETEDGKSVTKTKKLAVADP